MFCIVSAIFIFTLIGNYHHLVGEEKTKFKNKIEFKEVSYSMKSKPQIGLQYSPQLHVQTIISFTREFELDSEGQKEIMGKMNWLIRNI